MKKITLLALVFVYLAFGGIDKYFPKLSGRVVDDANILHVNTKQKLETLLKNEELNSSNQIVIATIKSLHGYEIEEFSIDLARKWALGQKGKDNGVLLLVAPNERRVRIEVGYGLEGALTDKISHEIITYTIIPAFKKGDFNKGVLKATHDIIDAIKGEYKPKSHSTPKGEFPIFVIFFLSFFSLIIGSIIKNDIIRKISLSSFVSAFSFPVSYMAFAPMVLPSIVIMVILATILFFIMKNKKFTYSKDFGSGYISSSGGGFGGGSFGGGFSGGGGSFGGGGASGGW